MVKSTDLVSLTFDDERLCRFYAMLRVDVLKSRDVSG